jgi:hypothetical protein
MALKFMSYAAQVLVKDGVPQCQCCLAPMVEVKPRTWQCAVGYALTQMIALDEPDA